MNKIKIFILTQLTKFKKSYIDLNKKSPYTEPITIISVSLTVVLSIILVLNQILYTDTLDIGRNIAESSYYNIDYDKAIQENENLQQNNKWPSYLVKNAEIYSLKGEYKKSNELLAKAIFIRDEYIKKSNRDLVIREDINLHNSIIFTYFLNGEVEQAISLGEDYLSRYPKTNAVQKTLFAINLLKNNKEKASDILKNYEPIESSAVDNALYAEMNLALKDLEKAFYYLEKAFNLDNNEIKVMEVLEDLNDKQKNKLIKQLEINSDENNEFHKVALAKLYSLNENTSEKSLDILKTVENKELLSKLTIKNIELDALRNLNRQNEALKVAEEIIGNKENEFYSFYIAAEEALLGKDYNKAIELSKKSIRADDSYANNFGVIIPDALMALGNPVETYPYLRTALVLEPFNDKIVTKIANIYARSKNYRMAQKFYSLALNLDDENQEIYYNLAQVYRANNNFEEAIEVLEKAIKLNSEDVAILRSLGAVQIKAKKSEEGISTIRKAYELDNNDPLVLNNAAVYYFTVENDFERGMVNMEAAYSKINSIKDVKLRSDLTSNYNWAKEFYDKYNSNGTTTKTPEFIMFY